MLLTVFFTSLPAHKYLEASISKDKIAIASWYDCKKKGECRKDKITASGEKFKSDSLTAAHRKFKFGTKLELTNILTGKKIIVTVNDRGPVPKNRDIDLSAGAAKKLGIYNQGVATIRMKVLK